MVSIFPYPARQRSKMRLESMKPINKKEAEIRRQAHATAILKGITMREAVFKALELWVKEKGTHEYRETSRDK